MTKEDNAISSRTTAALPRVPQRWRTLLPGEEKQIGALRRQLMSLLPGSASRDDVIAVAVELATNAIRHTASGRGGWFAVEVTWHDTAVQVAVADGGAPHGPRLIDDPMAEHGRGMQVVHALSAHTGVVGDQRGRLVWAQIPWDASSPGQARPPDGWQAAVRDGQDLLARRHPSVPAWFGRSTLQWWALAGRPGGHQLVAADTPQQLSRLLDTLPVAGTSQAQATATVSTVAARAGRRDLRFADRRDRRHKAPVPLRPHSSIRTAGLRVQPC